MVKLAMALLLVVVVGAAAQQMDDLRALRGKLAAGDLLSAESILKVHRAGKGEDAEYLLGIAWLARGAAMLGDWTGPKAIPKRLTRWEPRST